ncbi:polymorphic toxin-type HINT domain-containing protein [Pirellulaceae bacterium SH501]
MTSSGNSLNSGDDLVQISFEGIHAELEDSRSPLELELETWFGVVHEEPEEELPTGGTIVINPTPGGGTSGGSVGWAGAGGFMMGFLQGVCNVSNSVEDFAVTVANIGIAVPNKMAAGVDYVTGATDPHYQIRIPYFQKTEWARNLVIEEGGTPGGWDDMHGWSKFAGGEGAVTILTAGIGKVVTAVDDAGRCANWLANFIRGGCFVAGTQVTVDSLPYSSTRERSIWRDTVWLESGPADPVEFLPEHLNSRVSLRAPNSNLLSVSHTEKDSESTPSSLLIPIEQVPLGARVPTKNPKPWEFDDSLPEPDQDEWLKISITVERTDGGVVDVELLRPRAWVEANGIQAGQLLPLNIAELQVAGFAHVTAIETCPVIASGDGSVITGRFVTRQVDTIARVAILGADGSIEVLEGTTIHPIWSLDRNDWVELGELQQGEQLLGQAGPATVLSVTILWSPTAVYNIEVHGEHVYEVGALGVMVHNATDECLEAAKRLGLYLEDLKIVDGVGRLRVSFTDAIKHGDIARIVDFAKSQGASSLVLDTGQVVNPKIVESIERAIAAGKPFLGGNPRFIREIPNIIPSQPPVKIFEIVFQ